MCCSLSSWLLCRWSRLSGVWRWAFSKKELSSSISFISVAPLKLWFQYMKHQLLEGYNWHHALYIHHFYISKSLFRFTRLNSWLKQSFKAFLVTISSVAAHWAQKRTDTHGHMEALTLFSQYVCMLVGVLAGLVLQTGLGETAAFLLKGNDTEITLLEKNLCSGFRRDSETLFVTLCLFLVKYVFEWKQQYLVLTKIWDDCRHKRVLKFMVPNFCYKIIWPLGRIEDIIESWSLFICKSALPTQYLYPLVFLLLLIAVTVLHYKGTSINFVHQLKSVTAEYGQCAG